ncbi:MAG: hypothetical protein PVH62_05075 [Anaerolineae bacterium]
MAWNIGHFPPHWRVSLAVERAPNEAMNPMGIAIADDPLRHLRLRAVDRESEATLMKAASSFAVIVLEGMEQRGGNGA